MPPDLTDWMHELGWVQGALVGRSQLWRHVPTGNQYRLPLTGRVDYDRVRDEVALLSPLVAL